MIADHDTLASFLATWHHHHPLTPEQLAWAGRPATVAEVGFYHGGDVLYSLGGVPGIWHEQCLTGTSDRAT